MIMTEYANLSYYLDKWAGEVDSAVFPRYLMRATQIIKQYIGNNLASADEVPTEVKMCCCEVADYLYWLEQKSTQKDSSIKSESVGDLSVSYATAEEVEQQKAKQIRNIVYCWLADTGLLYRGC